MGHGSLGKHGQGHLQRKTERLANLVPSMQTGLSRWGLVHKRAAAAAAGSILLALYRMLSAACYSAIQRLSKCHNQGQ